MYLFFDLYESMYIYLSDIASSYLKKCNEKIYPSWDVLMWSVKGIHIPRLALEAKPTEENVTSDDHYVRTQERFSWELCLGRFWMTEEEKVGGEGQSYLTYGVSG